MSRFIREIPHVLLDKAIVGTFGANVLIMILGVIGGILMARALGPEGRGQIAAVLITASTVNWLFNCGLSWGNLYYLNKLPDSTSVIITNSLLFAGIMSGPVIVAGSMLILVLFKGYPADVRAAAFIYFATIPVAMAADYLISSQQALQQFQLFNGLRIGRQGIQVLLMTGLLLFKSLTVVTAILSVTIANIAIAIVALIWFKRHYWRGPHIDIYLLKKCVKFGLKAYFGSLAQTGNRRLDQIMMVILVSPTQLGLYSVAASISEGVSIVPVSIAAVATPRVAHADEKTGKRLLKKNAFVSGFVVGILVVFAILAANLILLVLYGEAFSVATVPLQILLLAAWFLGMGDLVGQGLTGLGRPMQGTFSEITALVLTVVLLLILVPMYGIVGAALASLGAYALRFMLMAFFAFGRHGYR